MRYRHTMSCPKPVEIVPFQDDEGISRCKFILDKELVAVRPQPRRPFQGWRYLRDEDAPVDLPKGAVANDMPEKKDLLTRRTCKKCKRETMHKRFCGWRKDGRGTWHEKLQCRVCKTTHERKGLPRWQEHLNDRYPVPPEQDMGLFAFLDNAEGDLDDD